jgi:hypothetical protein
MIEGKKHKLPFNMKMPTVRILNWIIVVVIFSLGLVCGGIASLKTLIYKDKVGEFHLFDKCYGCD